MNDIQNIITERVDDIPLLLEQMPRMTLPTFIDHHFPTHGNWQGLSLGGVSTIWLSSILSRGDHRLVHVEPWSNSRLWMLRRATGQAVERLDFTDDRLALVLQYWSDDMRWAQFESALNQHTVRVYDLSGERIHVDSTTASSYATVNDAGLFQFGHSKDHRPDLPQVKVMQAVLDPLGMPLARMWCRVSGPMIRCICPALRGSKRASAGTGCYMWGTVRWRRVTRAPGSPLRVIITCARCPRCNWPRASSMRPLRRSAMVNTPSVR
jgi:hypothetical protein